MGPVSQADGLGCAPLLLSKSRSAVRKTWPLTSELSSHESSKGKSHGFGVLSWNPTLASKSTSELMSRDTKKVVALCSCICRRKTRPRLAGLKGNSLV